LLGADVLHVQAEDAGELGQVIRIAAGSNQLQHVRRGWQRPAARQAVLAHVGLFILPGTRRGSAIVERKAHLVEGIALFGLLAVKRGGAGNQRQGGSWTSHVQSPVG
jgi:hypothetical protein